MGPEAFRQSGSRRRTGLRDTAMTRPPAGRLLPMTIDRGENVPVEARHPDPAASARILPRTGPGHPRRASARVYACDIDGLIVRVNRLACELWGRSPKLLDTAQRFCGSFRVESLDGDFIPPSETPMARAVLAGEASKAPKRSSKIRTGSAGWRASTSLLRGTRMARSSAPSIA